MPLGSIQILLDSSGSRPILESIQASDSFRDWIDPIDKEPAMHPLSYLFDDIYRSHWGIPRADRAETHHDTIGWRRRSGSRAGSLFTDLSLDRFKR
jgi:hypothetical protein